MNYFAEFFSWSDPERAAAATHIRYLVFVDEQRVPEEEELDSTDEIALHVLVHDRETGEPVATGRLYEDAPGIGRIGRMAVLTTHRGRGAGACAMRAMMAECWRRGWRGIILDAQDHAIPFYARHGFEICGPPHLDCGIPHHMMDIGEETLREKLRTWKLLDDE